MVEPISLTMVEPSLTIHIVHDGGTIAVSLMGTKYLTQWKFNILCPVST